MMTNHLTRRLAAVAHDFGQPAMIWQAVAFFGSLALAWLLARHLRGRIDARRRAAGHVTEHETARGRRRRRQARGGGARL